MKKLALALLLCSASASATVVEYTTSGKFMNSTNTVTSGGQTITFTGISPTADVTTPSFSSLGTFQVSGVGTGNFTDSFTLTIMQTVPSVNNGSSSTTVDGTLTKNSSTIMLTFVPVTVALGAGSSTVDYTFTGAVEGLNNPNVNGGLTTIQALISSDSPTSIPEPASLGLIGGSLLGFGLFFRRRIAKKR